MKIEVIILFVVSLLYFVAYFVEIPLFYEGNPKTRFLIEKMGKTNYKRLLIAFAVIFLALALYLR
jgi:hypothetical protein